MNHPRSSLLKIDVSLEIRKLTQNRFKSSTEWAVALCRYLISCGATALDIRLSRGEVHMRATGTQLEEESLRLLSVIFDITQPLDERHRAIVEMENSPSFELLCAFYLKKASVRMSSGGVILQTTKSKHSVLGFHNRKNESLTEPSSVMVISSGKINAHALSPVISRACRHALIPVYLNGRQIAEGLILPDCFVQQTFETDGVRGVVGIPEKSDFVRQVILRHGVVVKDSLKQPAFGLLYHAIANSERDVDELRHMRSVVRHLYLNLGARVESLNSEQKKRAVEVLFDRFLETKDRNYIVGVRAFETIDGNRLSLEQIHQLASMGPLYAVSPESSTPWLHCGRLVFILDAKQWNFLEKDLDITITTPPAKTSNRALLSFSHRALPGASNVRNIFSPKVRLAADHIIRNIR